MFAHGDRATRRLLFVVGNNALMRPPLEIFNDLPKMLNICWTTVTSIILPKEMRMVRVDAGMEEDTKFQ